MKVKFWGTRGSLPQATSHQDAVTLISSLIDTADKQGIRTLRTFKSSLINGDFGNPISYGGNTTCTEITSGNDNFFVDMGSGLREAGTFYMNKGVKEFHIFLTHMHWDHVMGMPFFVPVHVPGHTIKIYHVHRNAPEYVRINFNGINFPLTWEQLGGKVEFIQLKLYEPVKIGDTSITPFVLDHPGGCFGFRFDARGKSCVIGVDGEYKRVTTTELGRDLQYYQNLDLLVFDAQYEIAELASRFDWGHCTPNIGVDLALRERIKAVAFTHHDPWATPDKLRKMLKVATDHCRSQMRAFKSEWSDFGRPAGPNLLSAYDGLVIDLDNL